MKLLLAISSLFHLTLSDPEFIILIENQSYQKKSFE